MGKIGSILLLAGVVAHAASFDCAKVKTAQEKSICASPKLSAADDQMATAYKKALAATPSLVVAGVKADQRAWLGGISLQCPPGRVRMGQDMTACLLENYKERTKALRQLVQRIGGVTLVWRSAMLLNRQEPASDPSEQEASNEIDLIPGYGTLAVSWPQSNAPTAEWQVWNKAIQSAAQRVASQNHAAADGEWQPEWADDDDGDLTVTIGVVNAQLVAAFIDRWGWRGAHPWEDSIQFNWLLKMQRELKPEDVFRPNSNWDQLLVQHCMEDLKGSLGPHYENSDSGADGLPGVLHEIVQNPENWNLNGRGLSIIFQDYAIAPRMLHPGPVVIPWSVLRPCLQPDFTIPR
jgi:uncharacterized protein